MEFRRFAYTAISTRPVASLYPRAVRQFGTSAARLADDQNPNANANSSGASSASSASSSASASKTTGSNNATGRGNMWNTEWLNDLTATTMASTSQYRPQHNNRTAMDSPPLEHLTSSMNTKLPKMGPTAGRSIIVQADVAQAFMKLRSIISQNKVRQDFHRQKFYEPKGIRRKRLRSERYRVRFKEGFRRMISVVLDMKKKGM
ncbi:hypothetical protein BZA05DRAFT_393339 [Tricharina praecox]|uniref:uncharacterized protein n=1 Tax=Tricharina praecox TaxID=43433 RepID=UPI0022208390|nr:uncharacterized protein BZA05DRAFT_393339 [Tricharina praecox]KAI5854142.1 hypothetical protein BZA05DRAFT_393339 [Tricharina praecox]